MSHSTVEPTLPPETEAELERLLIRRHELMEDASELSNAALAQRYGVSTAYVSRVAGRVVFQGEARQLYRQLQDALAQERGDYALFRGQDGIVRVCEMDTSLVHRDGFLGVVNADTATTDIRAMVAP